MTAGAADKPHDRADVDDRAAAGLRHLLGRQLGAEKDAGLIDRDDALPALQAIRIADRAAGDPGIVDEDVDPAIARQCLRDQGHPFGLAGHVDRRGDAFPAGRANVGCNRLSCVAQDIGNDDLCAFRSE